MKKLKSMVLITGLMFISQAVASEDNRNVMKIYDGVIFYDGYMMDNNPDKGLDDGVTRHSCSLYSKKLIDSQLDALGEKLDIQVTVEACCDNYDRIGNINIALVEKGQESYIPEETQRIEIGRFITPFMDKNKEPKQVPYSYETNYLSSILRDKALRDKYDLWLEFELFGVPYAANQQIAGCAGRSDVFAGTLELSTTEPAGPTEGNILVPIVIKKPEYIGTNLNNYREEATDELGKTIKTYSFDVPEDVVESQIVLITSNHGANANGEEYNRRWHFVYFDDELVLTYRPGRDSCEPFRQYNTQANGIYGNSKKSDALWQSFSNWCPGDVIDNRIIELEEVAKGEHKIRIEVPDAEFVDNQGDIPVSIYFHGSTTATPDAVLPVMADKELPVKFSNEKGIVTVTAAEEIEIIEVFSMAGERIEKVYNSSMVDLRGYRGVVIICTELSDGRVFSAKLQL